MSRPTWWPCPSWRIAQMVQDNALARSIPDDVRETRVNHIGRRQWWFNSGEPFGYGWGRVAMSSEQIATLNQILNLARSFAA